jgi:hypothetical protein
MHATFLDFLKRVRAAGQSTAPLPKQDWTTMARTFYVLGVNILNESFG